MNFPVTILFLFLVVISLSAVPARIINGEDVDDVVRYSTMVSGHRIGDPFETRGGGSFVSVRHVLTSPILLQEVDFWYVHYGGDTLDSVAMIYSNKSVIHPQYDPLTFEFAIGIVVLPRSINSSE